MVVYVYLSQLEAELVDVLELSLPEPVPGATIRCRKTRGASPWAACAGTARRFRGTTCDRARSPTADDHGLRRDGADDGQGAPDDARASRPPPVPAVLLDTPFGFQENAVELAQRVSTYFRDSLRATIEVASAVEDAGGAAGTTGASGSPGVAGAKGSAGGGGTASGSGTAGSGGALDDDPFAQERLVSSVRNARYVFAGPGSPTYALRKWSGTVVPSLLKEKLRHGGASRSRRRRR